MFNIKRLAKMTLELKHIAPYLPYDLKVLRTASIDKSPWSIEFLRNPSPSIVKNGMHNFHSLRHASERFCINATIDEIQPILMPISILKDRQVAVLYFDDDSELLGDEWTPYAKAEQFIKNGHIEVCEPFSFWQRLFKDHIDVFGLIDNGLAHNALELQLMEEINP